MTRVKFRRRQDKNEVVAATAGLDNWKTWAGRKHGGDEFKLLDLIRGAKRKFAKRFVRSKPTTAGTPCPVCFVEPDSPGDWHTTSACGHAVCIDCLSGYAASQVRDIDHSGPLKCPVCARPLREKDAIAALSKDDETIRLWDAKIRDEVLRALPSYRHCPRCNSTSGSINDDDGNGGGGEARSSKIFTGGGFVTPECLAPVNEERERNATELLNKLLPVSNMVLTGGYVACLYMYSQIHSNSVFVDLINICAPMWLMRRLWLGVNWVVARSARRALLKPIVVECPCCDEAFILNAEAELLVEKNAVLADEASLEWIGSNTRPCPSCSVPISKIDGCNHMRCSHCRARFCWACMRSCTSCVAYRCYNGAPYGESVSADVQNNEGGTTIDRIVQLERKATRLDQNDLLVAFFGTLISIATREIQPVDMIAKVFIVSFWALFTGVFVMTVVLPAVLFYVLLLILLYNPRRHRQ